MALLAALQFLTRLPIRLPRPVPGHRYVVWFGVAGALVGLLTGGVAWLAAQVLPLPVAGTVGVVVGLLVTGAFHEDGLGDVADAFGGGWDVQQRLEILKDSRQGTYGVTAIVASVGLRMLLAGTVPDPEALLVGFVVAGALGRVALLVVLALGRPATTSGMAASLYRRLSRPMCLLGALTGTFLAGAALALGWAPDLLGTPAWWPAGAPIVWLLLLLTLATLVAALAVWRLAVAKIGGVVGDVLGATEQVAEVAVWLVLVAAVHSAA